MLQVIYTSTATEPFSAADLKQLLKRARMRNTSVGVSGMLIYHDGAFLQALEGQPAAVAEVFARIEKDRRHDQIQLLHRDQSFGERRVFGDWAMGFADASGAAEILNGFIQLNVASSLASITRETATTLLTECRRLRLTQAG
jgi:hypothetical protein